MEINEHRLDIDLPSMRNSLINQDNFQQFLPNNSTSTNPSNRITHDQFQQIIEIIKNHSATVLPFLFILILKSFYDHSAGIFLFFFFVFSIFHINSILIQQTSMKSNRDLKSIIRLLILLCFSLFIFLYVYRDDQLYKTLIFKLPNYSKWNLSTLLWILLSTFYLIKIMILIIKCILLIYPLAKKNNFNCLTYRRRGNVFSLIEYLSEYYLSLLTIRPWIQYLLNPNEIDSYFSKILFLFYIFFKILNLLKSTKQLIKSIKQILSKRLFPSVSIETVQDLQCPICQSDFQNPILLTCQHIFCEDCVTVWLNQNNTCPLCRQNLPIDLNPYRDGSTSLVFVWY